MKKLELVTKATTGAISGSLATLWETVIQNTDKRILDFEQIIPSLPHVNYDQAFAGLMFASAAVFAYDSIKDLVQYKIK